MREDMVEKMMERLAWRLTAVAGRRHPLSSSAKKQILQKLETQLEAGGAPPPAAPPPAGNYPGTKRQRPSSTSDAGTAAQGLGQTHSH